MRPWEVQKCQAKDVYYLLAQYNLIPNMLIFPKKKRHRAFLGAFNTEKINSYMAPTWGNFVHTTHKWILSSDLKQ